MKPKNLSAFLLSIGTLLLSCASLQAVEIVAHRGASADAPENTVASQNLAWRHHADAAEFDVRLTKDGKLVVIHDANTKRTTGRDAEIANLTLDEIRKLDASFGKVPQFAGEKIPTLDEMLSAIPPGKRVIIHVKIGAEIIPELAAALKRQHITPKQAAIISFDYEPLKAIKQSLPDYEALWLINTPSSDPKKKTPTVDELIRDCRAANFNGLDFSCNWPLDHDGAKKIKAAGLALHTWTVDLPLLAQRWIDLGVDGITTNSAGWLREQIAPGALGSSPALPPKS